MLYIELLIELEKLVVLPDIKSTDIELGFNKHKLIVGLTDLLFTADKEIVFNQDADIGAVILVFNSESDKVVSYETLMSRLYSYKNKSNINLAEVEIWFIDTPIILHTKCVIHPLCGTNNTIVIIADDDNTL